MIKLTWKISERKNNWFWASTRTESEAGRDMLEQWLDSEAAVE